MTTKSNKDLIQQFVEAQSRRDLETVGKILSPRFAWQPTGSADTMGRDAYLAGVEAGYRAFADSQLTIDDLLADGDRVALRATFRGRHAGEFMDMAPTGRTVTFTTIWFYEIVEDHIVRAWSLDQDFTPQLR